MDIEAAFRYAVAYGGTLAGLVLLARAVGVARRTRRFIRDATRAQGRILGYTEKAEEDLVSDATAGSGMSTQRVTAYYPQVRFTTAAGSAVVFESRDRAPHRGVGLTVPVIYDPRDPGGTAQIEHALNPWVPFILAALPAVALLTAGLIFLRVVLSQTL